MQKQQVYIQLIGNLAIPLLGYFWWNWSLYFILLFYTLDLLAGLIVVFLKARKIKQVTQNTQIPTSTFASVAIMFFALIVALFHIGSALLHPSIDFQKEIITFLTYTEMGIQQWIVLVPMVGLMAYSSYKMEFILPQLFLQQDEKTVWKNYLKEQFLMVAFSAILMLISVAYHFSDLVVLLIILAVTTIYNFLQKTRE